MRILNVVLKIFQAQMQKAQKIDSRADMQDRIFQVSNVQDMLREGKPLQEQLAQYPGDEFMRAS